MRKIFFALLFACLSLPAVAAEKESAYDRVMRTGVLRCGFAPWPPYFNLDPNTQKLSGLSKDLSDDIAELLGWKIEYIQVVVGQEVTDLASGKVDAVCGASPWVISSIKYVDYTKPYFYVAVYAYGRAEEARFSTLDHLNSPEVSFVGIDGDLSTDLVQSGFPQAKISTLPATTDPSQMLLNVATKKADVVIVDPPTVSLFSQNNPGKIKIIGAHPIAVYGGGFSVKKAENDLLNTLSEAVNAVINTGQADRVLKKYDPDGTLFFQAARPYKTSK